MKSKLQRYFADGKSFTLVELLVVIGILAVLTAAVILVINPVEYLRQARDTTRMSDLDSIDKALAVLETQGVTSFGTASTVYVSVADNASSTCGSLGLPALPSGWSYHCVTSTNLQKTDGNGWIPVNFTQSPALSFSNLPLDPVNATSTGNYYTYTSGGSWEINTVLESQKYRSNTILAKTNFPGVYAKGSNLTLSPIFNISGLEVYWALDEGSGTTAYDKSGHGITGSQQGTGTHYTTGKVGAYAGQFNGTDDGIRSNTTFNLGQITISAWVYPQSTDNQSIFTSGHVLFRGKDSGSTLEFIADLNNYGFSKSTTISGWTLVTATWNYAQGTGAIYINGTKVKDGASGDPAQASTSYISLANTSWGLFEGYIDDFRLYSRALSDSEVQAIYNTTK